MIYYFGTIVRIKNSPYHICNRPQILVALARLSILMYDNCSSILFLANTERHHISLLSPGTTDFPLRLSSVYSMSYILSAHIGGQTKGDCYYYKLGFLWIPRVEILLAFVLLLFHVVPAYKFKTLETGSSAKTAID